MSVLFPITACSRHTDDEDDDDDDDDDAIPGVSQSSPHDLGHFSYPTTNRADLEVFHPFFFATYKSQVAALAPAPAPAPSNQMSA